MVLGDAVSKWETFVWILNHISKSITWSLFTLKPSYLVKWPMLTWSFMCWCQFIDWLKFETRASPLLNFGTANSILECRDISERVLWTPWCSAGKQITFTFTFTFLQPWPSGEESEPGKPDQLIELRTKCKRRYPQKPVKPREPSAQLWEPIK